MRDRARRRVVFYGYFLVVKPPIPYVPRHFYTDEIVLDAVYVSVCFLVVKPPISYVPHNLYTGEIVLDARALAEAGAPQSFALTRKGKPEKGEVTLGASFMPIEVYIYTFRPIFCVRSVL